METRRLKCITFTRKHNHADGSHTIPCKHTLDLNLEYDNRNDSMDADDDKEVLFEAACKCRCGRSSQETGSW